MTRKRSKGSIKTQPPPEGSAVARDEAVVAASTQTEEPIAPPPPPVEAAPKRKENGNANLKTIKPQASWYTRTWPGGQKAEPSTQVDQKSNIQLDPKLNVQTPNIQTEHTAIEGPPTSTPKVKRKSSKIKSPMDKLVPAATTTTGTVSKISLNNELEPSSTSVQPRSVEETPQIETAAIEDPPVPEITITPDPAENSSWFGWWGQPKTEIKEVTPEVKVVEPEAPAECIPEPTPVQTAPIAPATPTVTAPIVTASTVTASTAPAEPTPEAPPAERPRSWLSVWPLVSQPVKAEMAKDPEPPVVEPVAEPQPIEQAKDELIKQSETAKPASIGSNAARTSWAFWSSTSAANSTAALDQEPGEVAVSDTPSQANPQKAKAIPEPTKDVNDPPTSTEMPGEGAVAKPPPAKAASQAKQQLERIAAPANLLVPSFESCYMAPPSQGLLDQITKYFKAVKPSKHHSLQLVSHPPKIKKAVAIGVHGFFPMKLLQRVLGEPTGTSLRFATAGAAAIQRWADARGMQVQIQKIALEGEGKVADRVTTLWKLLRNWLQAIEEADYVLFACHSQGTPVGVQLVAKLIEHGHADHTKVGIVGMAGINLGPFAEFNSRIFTGSAKELFEFSNANSTVTKKYIESLRTVISHGVKIVLVASVDDQLVPLESATFSNISHPFIFRAVFVDGRVHAPDFISHLVGFALKLRNIGVSDHGVIRELSAPLAGSLYSGEGHSRIYDDVAIYDLAVRHSLETTTNDFLEVPLRVEEFELPGVSNPFYLPWSMRGLLEEKHVRDELEEEAKELLVQFDRWKPVTKQLKDVKFRLEAIKSKL